MTNNQKKPEVAIILPAFNEELALGKLIED